VNKSELVEAVGDRIGDRRTAAVAVDAVLDVLTGALADGQRVALFGFGVFERVERAARTARNPATGGTVEVPATAVPRFRPGAALKKAVAEQGGEGRQDRRTRAGVSSQDDRHAAEQRAPEPPDDSSKAARKQSKKAGKKAKSDSKAKGKAGKKGR
jgi:DNA-binding protein HU-beta